MGSQSYYALQLTKLIDELKTTITNCLEKEDLVSLSSTCRTFRKFLSPSIFESLLLRNSAESEIYALRLSKTLRRDNVRCVHFEAGDWLPPMRSERWNPKASKTQTKAKLKWPWEYPYELDSEVQKVLSNLSVFPNLQRLTVRLTFDLSSDPDSTSPPWKYEIYESTESQITGREWTQYWRAFMTEAWRAISQNTGHPSLKSLRIRDLMCKGCTAYSEPAFGRFLQTIEHLSIELFDFIEPQDVYGTGSEGEANVVNAFQAYTTFCSRELR